MSPTKTIKRWFFGVWLGTCFWQATSTGGSSYNTDHTSKRVVYCTAFARFSVLTSKIIRCEYSKHSVFEDSPTLPFLYRNQWTSIPEFTVHNSSRWCNITTAEVLLSFYKPDSTALRKGKYSNFRMHQLQARSVPGSSFSWSWSIQNDASNNLKGTLKPVPPRAADLGGCCNNPNASAGKYDPHYPLGDGLLSKDGWALVDDSDSPLMVWNTTQVEDAWISTRPRSGATDLYLFGCGRDYRGCLKDYTKIAGPIAFPTLNSLGVWWSRHWGDSTGNAAMVEEVGPMSEEIITRDVLKGYEQRNLPLQVLVLDMEWHEMMKPPECKVFEGIKQWGGYTWNRTLFRDPSAFVTKLHQSRGATGVHLALNFHPDSGIDLCQQGHNAMAEALGLDPFSAIGDIDGPNSYNQTYVEAYFKYMIDPTFADIAWTDTSYATTWTNWLYVWHTRKAKKKRGINFSRYSGLGNHRTPVGFSGDTIRKWGTLEFEVMMTPLASNVGFGWWSHDIGGFRGSDGWIDKEWHTEDPELYLRWLQFGALSPILRTHCRYCDQRIWTWSNYDTANVSWYELMQQPLLLRNALVPYIYSHAYLYTFLEGESLLQPMYWDEEAAENEQAFSIEVQRQYFFGRNLLAAPITEPLKDPAQKVQKYIWLPTSDSWFDFFTMKFVGKGPAGVDGRYSLGDIPLFIRGGDVLPLKDMRSAYTTMASPILWLIVLGYDGSEKTAYENSFELYEDDGLSLGYQEGKGLITQLQYEYYNQGAGLSRSFNATISSDIRNGGFEGMREAREHCMLLGGVHDFPKSVFCDGVEVHQLVPNNDGKPGFWMDEKKRGLIISCGSNASLTKTQTVSATLSESMLFQHPVA